MELKNTVDVDELLGILRANKVEAFEGLGVKVSFHPTALLDEEPPEKSAKPTDPKKHLEDADLYLSAGGP